MADRAWPHVAAQKLTGICNVSDNPQNFDAVTPPSYIRKRPVNSSWSHALINIQDDENGSLLDPDGPRN